MSHKVRLSRVFLLRSTDIRTNLAFENSLYETADLTQDRHFLLWRSDPPCVVIGRHQNPWLEANVGAVRARGWGLVRRHSGGGAVFHDGGNLNLSFMMGRREYNRPVNMTFLAGVLQRRWNKPVTAGCRDDLWLDGKYKISGSSSKLGSRNTYHHCTLLFGADLSVLSGILRPSFSEIKTGATTSVRSPVENLGIDGGELERGIVEDYAIWQRQLHAVDSEVITVAPGDEAQWVDRSVFQRSLETLHTWAWTYGRTPKFDIRQPLPTSGRHLTVTCDRGHLVSLAIDPVDGVTDFVVKWIQDVVTPCLAAAECRPESWLEALHKLVVELNCAEQGWEAADLRKEVLRALLTMADGF